MTWNRVLNRQNVAQTPIILLLGNSIKVILKNGQIVEHDDQAPNFDSKFESQYYTSNDKIY